MIPHVAQKIGKLPVTQGRRGTRRVGIRDAHRLLADVLQRLLQVAVMRLARLQCLVRNFQAQHVVNALKSAEIHFAMVSLLADSQSDLLLVEHIKSEQILLFLRAVAMVQGAMSTKLCGFGNSKIVVYSFHCPHN